MSAPTTLYDELQVASTASDDDIRRAYRKLVLVHHPDKGGKPEDFKRIHHAYEVLSCPDKKREYDTMRTTATAAAAPAGASGGNPFFSDVFMSFFRHVNLDLGHGINIRNGSININHPTGRPKLSDHEITVHVSQKEAHTGVTRVVEVRLTKQCFDCQTQCLICNGQGRVMPATAGLVSIMQHCFGCNGLGVVFTPLATCTRCHGKLKYQEPQKIIVNVVRGVENGASVVYKGFGEQKVSPLDTPGDLMIRVQVAPDSLFKRQNLDYVYKVSLDFMDAVFGTTITVPHYDGDLSLDLSTICVIGHNDCLMLRDKGVPDQNGVPRGNLMLVFEVVAIPKWKEKIPDTLRQQLSAYLATSNKV